MVDVNQCYNDVLACLDFYLVKLSQTPPVEREDDVEDVDNVDIGEEMNKQVPMEDLSPNYD